MTNVRGRHQGMARPQTCTQVIHQLMMKGMGLYQHLEVRRPVQDEDELHTLDDWAGKRLHKF
jgi:predicted phage gp36 major capsid-like protein